MSAERIPAVSVIMPVYNERATIEEIIRRVQMVDMDKEILIVDDGSTDGTREFLADLARHATPNPGAMTLPAGGQRIRAENIRVLFQERNQGKGAALRRGFQEARGSIVIIQDADLEYNPDNFHKLIEPIERGDADVVYGSRFLGGPHRVLFFWHYVGNKFLTTLSDMFTDLNLSDVWTCYKAFRREVLKHLDLRENRFGFEQEITSKIAKNGWRVFEVPISYYGRTYAEGKKITWKDGLQGLWCILRYSSRARRPSEVGSQEPEGGRSEIRPADGKGTASPQIADIGQIQEPSRGPLITEAQGDR
ncbi:MAG: glycosyl transferase [Acidobacteria bacterium]|nr:MAG: glycosyl transferase [Acidobacteriota bacterium]